MTFLRFVLILSSVLLAVVLVVLAVPSLFQFARRYLGSHITPDESTAVLAVATIILALVTTVTLLYVKQSDERAEQVFIGENRPRLDVTPIAIAQDTSTVQATTFFSVVNYSGFIAYDISLDIRYGDSENTAWIGEWRKAKTDLDGKGAAQGVVDGTPYLSRPTPLIPQLGVGQTTSGQQIMSKGSLNLETVCTYGPKGLPVFVRVTWRNENGHVFDEIHKYKLICTKVSETGKPGSGRAFTFIPEGIVSQKAAGLSGSVAGE